MPALSHTDQQNTRCSAFSSEYLIFFSHNLIASFVAAAGLFAWTMTNKKKKPPKDYFSRAEEWGLEAIQHIVTAERIHAPIVRATKGNYHLAT